MKVKVNPENIENGKSIIGAYGSWADGLVGDPPMLSFRNDEWESVESWRTIALQKAKETVSPPDIKWTPNVMSNK